MKRKRHTEEQIIAILKERAGGCLHEPAMGEKSSGGCRAATARSACWTSRLHLAGKDDRARMIRMSTLGREYSSAAHNGGNRRDNTMVSLGWGE
jgi:hypothetical protein